MKLVQINVADFGSTGAIVKCIGGLVKERGGEAYAFVGRKKGSEAEITEICGKAETLAHGVLARIGANGHGSVSATRALIKRLSEIQPDTIILHNVHGYYLNIKILFSYLKTLNSTKIIWVLHDCWAFTGGCVYYTDWGCTAWENGGRGCGGCPVHEKTYPISYIDTSAREFKFKKDLFTGIKNMTVVTPSAWMASEVSRSFLSEYPVKIIKNGINTDVFRPASDETVSKIMGKYNIPCGKPYVLGVSSVWEIRKQPEMFAKLANLTDIVNVVMVGLSPKKQERISLLSKKVIFVPRTENREELAALYSGALALVNPSLDDTFPFTVLESLACGTPVVNSSSGGCPEQIDEMTGIVIKDANDPDEILADVKTILDSLYESGTEKAASGRFTKEACRNRAISEFSQNKMASQYLEL